MTTTKDTYNIMQALRLVENIENSRLTICPVDYPPSEWKQYKQVTKDLQEVRIKLSELYMLI